MAIYERIRDIVTAPFSQQIVERRIAAGQRDSIPPRPV
jgi:hypothetical protein